VAHCHPRLHCRLPPITERADAGKMPDHVSGFTGTVPLEILNPGRFHLKPVLV